MNDPTASLPPDQRIKALQAVGAIVMGLMALASAFLGERYPAIHAVTVLVSWVVGKLVGTPIAQVTRAAVKSMPPAAQAEIAVQTAVSMAPAARQDVIDRIVFLASDPPPPMPSTPPPPPTPSGTPGPLGEL